MRVEVLNTGSELLLGGAVNTHLAYLGRQLFQAGLRIDRQVCVPDGAAIREAMRDAFPRCEILIVTGGLGPTSDDLTRDVAAELFNLPLERDERVLAYVGAIFQRFGREMNASIMRQADVPRGATVLTNAHGTAPGLYLAARADDGVQTPHVFLLPGPPRELQPMVRDQLVPRLRELRRAHGGVAPTMRTFRVVGLGESQVEELVGGRLLALAGLELGYCARSGEVDVRLIGTASVVEQASEIMRVEPGLRDQIASEADESLEEVVVRLLRARGQTVSTAESCTGGLLASRLTNVPGSSEVVFGGITTYSNDAKERILGVPAALLEQFGAVSGEVAAEMARRARALFRSDYALSATGIAGPGGVTPEKPAGTLHLGLAGPDESVTDVKVRQFVVSDRETFKQLATQAALNLLRKKLVE